jgi:hypothetical protein
MLMKTVLALLMLAIVSLSSARGQFQFQADMVLLEPLPTSTNDWRGLGTFTLQGDTLGCRVAVAPFGPWAHSEIRAFGADGSVLFDLPLVGCDTPMGSYPGGCVFRTNLSLTDSAIADLMANWYVTATYQGPIYDTRMGGQIVLVPEPSTLTVLVLSAATSIAVIGILKRHRRGGHSAACEEQRGPLQA